jgi:hypothetical protein
MAAPITASIFPDDKYPYSIEVVRDNKNISEMDDTFHDLWDCSFIAVDNLPAPDLQNAIHPISPRAAFLCLASDTEYNFIRPAVKLASRIITEPTYLHFWTHLRTASPIERKVRRNGKLVKGEVLCAPVGMHRAAEAYHTKRELKSIANNVRFISLDTMWSEGDPRRVGETFLDTADLHCKRQMELEEQVECGRCADYNARLRGLCHVCGYREYRDTTAKEIKEVFKAHSIKGYSAMNITQLIATLEARDNADPDVRPSPVRPAAYKTTVLQRSHMRVGLHQDMITYIRAGDTAGWTECEELHFQYGSAATLVHELAHASSYWSPK